jgi:hypothetical protein
MAAFNRIDNISHNLNAGSTFQIADSKGTVVELNTDEAKRLARWLTSFLYAPFQKVAPLPEEEETQRKGTRPPEKWQMIQQACHDRVMNHKRLTLKQGSWLYNRYINCYNASRTSVPEHNRMVDELRIAQMRVIELERRLDEQEGKR